MQYIYGKIDELKVYQKKKLIKRYGVLAVISFICIIISASLLWPFIMIVIGGGPARGYDGMFWAIVTPLLLIFILSIIFFIMSIYKLFRSRRSKDKCKF